jgi:hypothetical protein
MPGKLIWLAVVVIVAGAIGGSLLAASNNLMENAKASVQSLN